MILPLKKSESFTVPTVTAPGNNKKQKKGGFQKIGWFETVLISCIVVSITAQFNYIDLIEKAGYFSLSPSTGNHDSHVKETGRFVSNEIDDNVVFDETTVDDAGNYDYDDDNDDINADDDYLENEDVDEDENQDDDYLEDEEETECSTFQNSDQWMRGPRVSNIDEEEMTDELIRDLILNVSPMDVDSNGSKSVLEQTLCHKDSGFLNWDKDPHTKVKNSLPEDDRKIQAMAFRLMYIAIHEHQYGPAREEALLRYGKEGECEEERVKSLQVSGVGRMDFECPKAKFLVTAGGTMGLGATMRTSTMDAMFLGMASNRVTLIMDSLKFLNATDELQYLSRGWPLASCPRKDFQCNFMPLSPCTLTEEEIKNAKVLDDYEVEVLRRTGQLSSEYDDERVVIIQTDLNGQKREPPNLRDVFLRIISSFYSNRKEETSDDLKKAWELDNRMLQKVNDFIKDKDKSLSSQWISYQVFGFYVLKPNMRIRTQIEQAMTKIFPQNYDPRTAIGLPIRASDKCRGSTVGRAESQCMNFAEQMDFVKDWVKMRTKKLREVGDDTVIDKIILTSEDSRVINARSDFPKSDSFPFDFIINHEDVAQGNGNPRLFRNMADQIMLSSMVSLKMQMNSESLVVNGCSNFHKVMYDQALRDCGVQNYIEFYVENEDPKYHLKCRWQK